MPKSVVAAAASQIFQRLRTADLHLIVSVLVQRATQTCRRFMILLSLHCKAATPIRKICSSTTICNREDLQNLSGPDRLYDEGHFATQISPPHIGHPTDSRRRELISPMHGRQNTPQFCLQEKNFGAKGPLHQLHRPHNHRFCFELAHCGRCVVSHLDKRRQTICILDTVGRTYGIPREW